MKLLTFALTSVTAGINLGGLSLIIPHQQIGKIIGIFGINFLTGKLSSKFGSASQLVEFKALSKLVESLNIHLNKIEKLCYKLIILEFQEEMNTDLETSKINIIKMKKEEISNLLEISLKGIDYSIDIEKKVKEEYIVLNKTVTEEQLNDDWLLEHLNISEIQTNDKNNKKEKDKGKQKDKDNKKKDKGGFDDDFEELDYDDL